MAFDDTYKLVEAALNVAEATNVYPNANLNGFATGSNSINLGRVGLPKGAQFVVGVDGIGGQSSATNLSFNLQLSLNNGTPWRTISTIEFDDPANVFNGKQARALGHDFAPQEYADANIDVRLEVVPGGGNASNNITATKIYAYITSGEVQTFGRKKTADTLFV